MKAKQLAVRLMTVGGGVVAVLMAGGANARMR